MIYINIYFYTNFVLTIKNITKKDIAKQKFLTIVFYLNTYQSLIVLSVLNGLKKCPAEFDGTDKIIVTT